MPVRRAFLSLTLATLALLPSCAFAQSDGTFLDAYFAPQAALENAGTAETGSVAILWEASSYAPPSYDGRPLPSAGSTVRLWAIPHLGGYRAEQLTYTWKLNGATLVALSGKGKAAGTIQAPELFGAYTVSVDVSSDDLAARASASVRIASVEPLLRLYAEHPLFGLQYWSAVGSNAFLPEREMTFIALPLFAPATAPDDAALRYAWRIDRNAISAHPTRPSSITVSAEDGAVATIETTVTHATNFLMESHGAWQVTLGAGAGAGVFDPFRTF